MIGELVGHYRVVSALGSGGMGVVWKAIDTRLNRPVALKAIRETDDTSAVLRLRAEALAAASLDHPYICKIYELLETGTATLVVMEFVEGETLADILSRRQPPIIDILRYGSEIAEGLANAHARGIIHRDVKPGNVMVTPHGHVKLLDFGVARMNDPAAITQSGLTLPGNVPGTPHYMAPEQALGETLDGRADIFSLGVLLFRCLAGRLPFDGETRDAYVQSMLAGRVRSLEELAPAAPASVRDVVSACLSLDRSGRPESAAIVAETLRHAAELLSTGTHGLRVQQPQGLPRWALQLGVLVLSSAVVGLIAYRWPWDSGESSVRRELVPVVTWPSGESDARISPDGRWLSFVSDRPGTPTLFVQTMEGGEAVTVMLPGPVLSHTWSPSGKEIAAVVQQPDGLFLAVVPAFFGGSPRTSIALPKTADDAAVLRWGGDTVFLQFNERGPTLWKVALGDGRLDPVSGAWADRTPFRGIDVSPDGTQVLMTAVVDGRTDLWVASIDGTRRRRITEDEAVERDPLWIDPDTIAFESTRGGQLDLWQMELGSGRAVQLTASLMTEQPTAASADGAVLAFEQFSNSVSLWDLSLASGAMKQLTADALSDYWPSTSADGRLIAFQRTRPTPAEGYQFFDARVFVAALADRELDGRPLDDGFGAQLSADGQWVAYYQRLPARDRLRIVVRNLTTGASRTLTEGAALPTLSAISQPVDWVERNMAWRPGFAELYFIAKGPAGHEVHRARLDGAAGSEPVFSSPARLSGLWMSPDGARVASQVSVDGGTELRAVELATTQPRTLARFAKDEDSAYPVGWASGERLVVRRVRAATGRTFTIDLVELAAGVAPRRIASLPDSYMATAVLDAAAQRVFITRAEGGLHNIDAVSLADGSISRLTANEARGVSFSGIHAAGPGRLVFARDERRRDIWIVKRAAR